MYKKKWGVVFQKELQQFQMQNNHVRLVDYPKTKVLVLHRIRELTYLNMSEKF